MKILILSANTGQGHNSCSRAIKEAFERQGDSCEICDSLAFMSEGISKFVTKLHAGAYRKCPGAFAWGYRTAQKHPAVFGKKSPLYKFFQKGAENLNEYTAGRDYDIVIACHVFPAVMLTEAGRLEKPSFKTAFVATDFTRSPTVELSNLDYYFIPDETLADEFVIQKITKEKIYSTGIPVQDRYFSCTDKTEAKRLLGVSEDSRHLMVMCGSMGCGPIEKTALCMRPLLGDGMEVSIICGTNVRLKERLDKKLGEDRRFHIYGYVDDTSLFMDSADLYLTKPGGISVCEAAVKRLPMIFVNAVSGCEEYNCSYFVNRGGAVCEAGAGMLAKKSISLLSDDAGLLKMSEALAGIIPGNPAESIRDILKN